MSAQRQMICQQCGITMNRHAAKIVEPRTGEEAQCADPALGGVVEHVHACPGCGKIASEH